VRSQPKAARADQSPTSRRHRLRCSATAVRQLWPSLDRWTRLVRILRTTGKRRDPKPRGRGERQRLNRPGACCGSRRLRGERTGHYRRGMGNSTERSWGCSNCAGQRLASICVAGAVSLLATQAGLVRPGRPYLPPVSHLLAPPAGLEPATRGLGVGPRRST